MYKKNSNFKQSNIENIKNLFAKPVLDAVKAMNEKKDNLDPILKVVIPEEFVEQLKDGTVKLMQSKNGEILPNIVGADNKVIKQVRIEEVQEKLNSNNINKLGEYLLEQKLDSIQEQLDYIVDILEDIEKSQKNSKYGKINGAIKNIRDSILEECEYSRQTLQLMAQSKLNEGTESLKMDIYDSIEFFKSWENRNFFEKNIVATKFTTKNINRKLNNLSKDYYYIKKSRLALAKLKLSQGMSWNKVNLIIEDIEHINRELENIDILGWMPPRDITNEWQYNLFSRNEAKNQLILEFKTVELLGELDSEQM